jgi:phosphoribosylglycinamide formyltransferase-1
VSIKKIVILFSGEGSNMEVLIEKLHNKTLQVAKAITNNPNANGINRAKKLGIDTLVIDHKKYKSREDYDKELVKVIQELNIDLVVLAGFMRILTPIFTKQIKAINIHPSLLPLYKGANALQRSFEGDEKEAGVTTHFVTQELDSGEIIMQKSFDKSSLSFDEFKAKIHECEYEIFAPSIIKVLKD